MTFKPHRFWCNCDECVRWRGTIVPEWKVAALDAKLESLNTRPLIPMIIFDPPLPTWMLTAHDKRFLRSLGIARD